jgi:hypothetical protein
VSADELDRLMIRAFGADYRDKVIVGPVGTFALAGVFDECGLRDPQAPPDRPVSSAVGLFQIMPSSWRDWRPA